jgi:hypothetical protein
MKRLGLLAVAVLGCSTLTFSQAAAETAVTTTKSPVIRHRYHRQQARIAQGVRSGQLTPRETARLERQEGHIRRETRRMKADGNFTPAERAKVRRDQNRVSRHIYRQKHDAQRVR